MDSDKQLQSLVTRLEQALGSTLDAVVLYGSAARGELDPSHPNLNTLILTHQITTATLRSVAPVFLWWMDLGHPQPLVFTREELRRSTDAFPIEIVDITRAHRVLYGEDPVTGLSVQRDCHRLQLEHELRSKLLRLRQKAAPLLAEPPSLLRLLEDSLSTFLVFLRHLLILRGLEAPNRRRELLAAADSAGLIFGSVLTSLVDLREGKLGPKAVDPVQLFEDYLVQIQLLVTSVDAL
jgi:hypothetical protein